MYFKLKDVEYQVISASVRLDIIPRNQELKMFIDIEAETDSKELDYELKNVHLYHNNGFQIGGKTLRNLKGKKYEWKKDTNRFGEEAGNLYVLEHEEVTSGVIEIIDVTKEKIAIKWTGFANVFWNDEFGENVPFETEIEASLPEIPKYKIINGMESTRFKLDKNSELILLNFEDILNECQRCKELWIQNDSEAWQKYDAVLKMKLIHKGIEYFGEADYKGSATQCETIIDESCPIKINIFKTTIDTTNGNYNFYISCT
ncbi:MAG: hypothetical protein J5625_01135 [Lachnospiraceae bacterium]|nr:hypothetical protein [Lachnospiraceae bacterium]